MHDYYIILYYRNSDIIKNYFFVPPPPNFLPMGALAYHPLLYMILDSFK